MIYATTLLVAQLGFAATNRSAISCHSKITALNKQMSFFEAKDESELGNDTRATPRLRKEFAPELSRDLSIAAVRLEWVQYFIDEAPEASSDNVATVQHQISQYMGTTACHNLIERLSNVTRQLDFKDGFDFLRNLTPRQNKSEFGRTRMSNLLVGRIKSATV